MGYKISSIGLCIIFVLGAHSSEIGAQKAACAKSVHLKARSVFRKHGRNPKPGWCTGNVYFILKELRSQGFPTSRTTVLFIESRGGHDFRLWGSSEQKLNRFHAALEIDGLVYDVHYGDRPIVLSIREYVKDMFTYQGLRKWEGARLESLMVKSIPGTLYLSLFRQYASKGIYRYTDDISRVSLQDYLRLKGLDPAKVGSFKGWL